MSPLDIALCGFGFGFGLGCIFATWVARRRWDKPRKPAWGPVALHGSCKLNDPERTSESVKDCPIMLHPLPATPIVATMDGIVCPACKGSKLADYAAVPCEVCGGAAVNPIPMNLDGEPICPVCNGNKIDTYWNADETAPCPGCKGTGTAWR